ncbi:MAG: cytidine/deoxycytidylate deaminase family protein [Bdellovibrio sp.]
MNDKYHEINFIPVKSKLNWDEYFMLQAMMASFKSKDPSTKVGSVFVDAENHQITMGYNGFVSGIDESKLPWGKDPSAPLEFQKYGYVVHSEANAILHATRSLSGSRCYVTLFPCNECAKLIASKKVSEVIYLSDKHQAKESTRIAKRIFDLAGIKYRQLEIKRELIDELHGHLLQQFNDI